MTDESVKKIASFLYYGYVPEAPDDGIREQWKALMEGIGKAGAEQSESDLIERGVQALRAAFENIEGDLHIVPISGGLDSRIILGGLLEAGLGESIRTVTFGTPGTLDYDLGRLVSERAGVPHERMDLTALEITRSRLIGRAGELDVWIPLFEAYYNRLVFWRFGVTSVYWSGFMGEALSGKHLPVTESETWESAKRFFAGWNRVTKAALLTPADFQPDSVLPEEPLFERNILSYDDQLDFFVRQQSYIRHLLILDGHDVRTPFLNKDWVSFMLSVPWQLRTDQSIYRKIAAKAYPSLFALPVKDTGSLPLGASAMTKFYHNIVRSFARVWRRLKPGKEASVYPMTNYIDFDTALKERSDIGDVVLGAVTELKNRGIVDWIDIDALWSDHREKGADFSDELCLLTSLEILLEASEQQS